MKKCLTKLKFHNHIYINKNENKNDVFELVGFEIINKKIYTVMLLGPYYNLYNKKDVFYMTARDRHLNFKFSNHIDENYKFHWVYSSSITKIILK
jgi:hypothetical protein